jgi:hypothetical protein
MEGILGIFFVLSLCVGFGYLEWILGKKVGKMVSKGTGLVLGIILIFLGFTFIAGIVIIMYSNKNKSDVSILPTNLPAANLDLNVDKKTSNEQNANGKISEFIGKNYKDILSENRLDQYIVLFERNNLTDISIISELNETDLEKLGISIMGDRKKILKLFTGV